MPRDSTHSSPPNVYAPPDSTPLHTKTHLHFGSDQLWAHRVRAVNRAQEWPACRLAGGEGGPRRALSFPSRRHRRAGLPRHADAQRHASKNRSPRHRVRALHLHRADDERPRGEQP